MIFASTFEVVDLSELVSLNVSYLARNLQQLVRLGYAGYDLVLGPEDDEAGALGGGKDGCRLLEIMALA